VEDNMDRVEGGERRGSDTLVIVTEDVVWGVGSGCRGSGAPGGGVQRWLEHEGLAGEGAAMDDGGLGRVTIKLAGRPRESEDRAVGVTWTMAEDGWMVQIYRRQNRQNGRTREGRLPLQP
jgi:hypothetical protein